LTGLWGFIALAGVTFFAATVQAATGFGFALLAVPFYLIIMGSLDAIQVAVVVSFVISLVLLPGLLKETPKRLLLHLVGGSIAGFPIGLWLFHASNLTGIKLSIGILITVFASLVAAREWRQSRSRTGRGPRSKRTMESYPVTEVAVGFLSGAMAVPLAMPGPVVVLYLAARQAGKDISRPATLLLFLFTYGVVTVVHAVWGEMSGETWWLSALLTPFVIAGAICGHFASRLLDESRFRSVVLVILIGSGLFAIWTAV